MNAFAGTNNDTGNNNNNGNNINVIDLVKLMERFGQYFIENITSISIVVVLIISALVYQQIMHLQTGVDITENTNINNSQNTRTVVVETFDNMDNSSDSSDSLDNRLKNGFCKSHLGKPAELETECGKLSKHSCTATSCCAWARIDSVESCVSGNQHGPIFKHGSDGAPKTLDYYYFENKCHGNCPTEK